MHLKLIYNTQDAIEIPEKVSEWTMKITTISGDFFEEWCLKIPLRSIRSAYTVQSQGGNGKQYKSK